MSIATAPLAQPVLPKAPPPLASGWTERQRIDFCIVGVQKSGTTALDHFIRQHPLVHMPHEKEVHFFDADRHFASGAPDYQAYHRSFPFPSPGSLTGESTPIYIFWPNALERLAAYNPAMRLIVVCRDPVERAYSHWRMTHHRGRDELPFSSAIREGRSRLADGHEFGLRNWTYVERGFYGSQARRVLAHFPRRQVLFLRAEDLRNRHVETLVHVFRFLSLPVADIRQEFVFCGTGPTTGQSEMTLDDRRYLRALFRDELREFAALTRVDTGPWLG